MSEGATELAYEIDRTVRVGYEVRMRENITNNGVEVEVRSYTDDAHRVTAAKKIVSYQELVCVSEPHGVLALAVREGREQVAHCLREIV